MVTGYTFYHWWEGDRQLGQNRRGFEGAQPCSRTQALVPKVTSWEVIGVVLQHKHPGLAHISRVAQPLTVPKMQATPLSQLVLVLWTMGTLLGARTPGEEALLGEPSAGTKGRVFHQDWDWPAPQVWPPRSQQDPLCLVSLSRGINSSSAPLLVVGALRGYEQAFLEAVHRAHWGPRDLATFGICTPSHEHAALPPLRWLQMWLGEPQGQRLVILHLEEGMWAPMAEAGQETAVVPCHHSPYMNDLFSQIRPQAPPWPPREVEAYGPAHLGWAVSLYNLGGVCPYLYHVRLKCPAPRPPLLYCLPGKVPTPRSSRWGGGPQS